MYSFGFELDIVAKALALAREVDEKDDTHPVSTSVNPSSVLSICSGIQRVELILRTLGSGIILEHWQSSPLQTTQESDSASSTSSASLPSLSWQRIEDETWTTHLKRLAATQSLRVFNADLFYSKVRSRPYLYI